jgi:hypothetical protein
MSLSNPLPRETRVSPPYACDGVNATFGVPFWFIDVVDLVVEVTLSDGSKFTLADGVGYSATGAGAPAGGAVVLVLPPPAGAVAQVFGKRLPSRLISVFNGGQVNGAALDKEQDAVVATLQELRRDNDRLATRVGALEPVETFSVWGGDGEVSVLSFPGVNPTGSSNSSAAFQAAMTAAGPWGKINVPAGTYTLDTALTGNALWNVRHGVTITGAHPTLPGVVMSAPNGRNLWSGALTGSGTGQQYFNSVIFTEDDFQNGVGNTYGYYVKLLGREPTAIGGRFAFGALCQWDTPGDPASTPGWNFGCGAILQGIANYDNTDPGGAAVAPSMYGGNSNVVATAAATDWGEIVGHEIDVVTYAGSTYDSRDGLDIVLVGTGPQGAVRDAGIVFKAPPGVTGWKHLIAFDKLSGGQPIATTGTILGVTSGASMTVAHGVDFNSGLSFTGYPFRSPGFSVDGDGDLLAKSVASFADYLIVKESAPADQRYARWTMDAGGNLSLQALSDSLVPSTWMTFSRSGAAAAAATFAVKVYAPAPATLAGFNMAPGSAPATPEDGDMWPTSANLFARINGATKTLGNLEDAQTFSGIKTFSAAPVLSVASGIALNVGSASGGSANPAKISFAGDYSTVAGAASKIVLLSGTAYGFGVSASQLDYSAPAAAAHVFYVNATQVAKFDASSLTLPVASVIKIGTNQIIGARKTGWGTPSGTLDRTALAAYAGQTVSAGYVQAEAQATDNAIKKLSQVVAALINDLHASGAGSTHMMLAN